ncbi:MAG: hypothetical protein QW594_03720 [Candidatus Woesearchaeota archaeon]
MERKVLSHYRQDTDGAYLLEIRITSLKEFFDPHDPSPLHKRDLNPRIVDMILKQLVIFPANERIRILIHLPSRFKKKGIEQLLEDAVKHHFEFEYLDTQLHLKRRRAKAKKTLLVASIIFVCLMAAARVIEWIFPDHVLWHFISEGLTVGAWVTMWHPIEMLLYEWIPLHEDQKKFSKLLKTDIQFVYEKA